METLHNLNHPWRNCIVAGNETDRFGQGNVESLGEFEEILGYTFKSKKLLLEVLTHSSAKDDIHPSNERLEFLGDSVLGMVISEHLFKAMKNFDEGEMTIIKSIVVSRSSLLKIAKAIGIKDYLVVGKGFRRKRSLPMSLVANSVESLIGALFLDSGIRLSRNFILQHFGGVLESALKSRRNLNYKSRLQYYSQKKFGLTPHYKLVTQDGPDHKKTFTLRAVVGKMVLPPGKGNTKKEASQKAAREALKILQEEYGTLPNPDR